MNVDLKAMDHFRLKLMAATWALGLVLTVGAVSSFLNAVHLHAGASMHARKAVPRIELISSVLPSAELANIAQQISELHPGVKLTVTSGGNLRVAIESEMHYSAWRAAIADLMQSGTPETVFETISICGPGCDGSFCAAEFSVKKFTSAKEKLAL